MMRGRPPRPGRRGIGALIQAERRKRGWPQKDFARKLGLSAAAVSNWEHGQTKPTVSNVMKMIAALGFPQKLLEAPGSPYRGEVVDDPEESLLLWHWRRLKPDQRAAVLRAIKRTTEAAAA